MAMVKRLCPVFLATSKIIELCFLRSHSAGQIPNLVKHIHLFSSANGNQIACLTDNYFCCEITSMRLLLVVD